MSRRRPVLHTRRQMTLLGKQQAALIDLDPLDGYDLRTSLPAYLGGRACRDLLVLARRRRARLDLRQRNLRIGRAEHRQGPQWWAGPRPS